MALSPSAQATSPLARQLLRHVSFGLVAAAFHRSAPTISRPSVPRGADDVALAASHHQARSVTERVPRRPEAGERRASPRSSGDGDDSKRGYAAHEHRDGGGGDHARGDARTRPAWSPGTRRRRQNAWRTGGGESARGHARTCSAGPP
ncbi:hypothetical protein ZEAMMB73_Zm00001d024447 [Zea mays]|nr:hypothetical protein ZEAMMB73_Zm00001d024447 [Zea mays]